MADTEVESGVYVPSKPVKTAEPSSKKGLAIYGLAGAGAGATAGALEATIGYQVLPPQVAQEMTNVGFNLVEYENGQISFFGAEPESVTWNEQGGYWEFNEKLNLDSMIALENLAALGAGFSALAIPLYAKKKPGIALAHALIAGGEVIGNLVKNNRLTNLGIHSLISGNTYPLMEYSTSRPDLSGTSPAVFYLDELALGAYLGALGAMGAKMVYDHVKNKPSEMVKDGLHKANIG